MPPGPETSSGFPWWFSIGEQIAAWWAVVVAMVRIWMMRCPRWDSREDWRLCVRGCGP